MIEIGKKFSGYYDEWTLTRIYNNHPRQNWLEFTRETGIVRATILTEKELDLLLSSGDWKEITRPQPPK